MRVNNNRDDRLKELGLAPGEKKKTESSGGTSTSTNTPNNLSTPSFQGVFLEHTKNISHEEISQLMKNMDEIGSRLAQTSKLEDFYHYKKTLQAILSKVIASTYDVEKTYSRPSLKNPVSKEFHTIKTINESLDSLLKMIKETQGKNIQLASKLTEIKGLIVNLIN